MRTRSALVAVAFAAATACSTTSPAPPHWTPTPKDAAKRILGHWIVVGVRDGPTISGELIAVGIYGQERDASTIYVALDDVLVAIPAPRVTSLSVVEHEPSTGGTSAWTWLGAFTTISHGWFVALTFPGWLVLGGVPAAVQGSVGVEYYDTKAWPLRRDAVRKFARFPQGLPPALASTAREVSSR